MAEVIVVIIIIGVLASLAIPNYRIQMLRIKNQEAVRILTALWEAQKDFFRDNGTYATALNQLAIDIPTPKNFQDPSLSSSPVSCTGPTEVQLARIDAADASYKLYILEDGRIVCAPPGGQCPGSLCANMGFPDW